MDQQFGCRERVSILPSWPASRFGLRTTVGSRRQQHCCRAQEAKPPSSKLCPDPPGAVHDGNLVAQAPGTASPNSGQRRAQCELAHTSRVAACATIFRHVEPKCERNLSSLQARQYSGRVPTARLSAENRQGSCVLSGHHLDEHLQGVRPHELGGYGRSDHRRCCA